MARWPRRETPTKDLGLGCRRRPSSYDCTTTHPVRIIRLTSSLLWVIWPFCTIIKATFSGKVTPAWLQFVSLSCHRHLGSSRMLVGSKHSYVEERLDWSQTKWKFDQPHDERIGSPCWRSPAKTLNVLGIGSMLFSHIGRLPLHDVIGPSELGFPHLLVIDR